MPAASEIQHWFGEANAALSNRFIVTRDGVQALLDGGGLDEALRGLLAAVRDRLQTFIDTLAVMQSRL